VWLITGAWLRPAALVTLLLGPLAALLAGPVAMLEAIDLLGVALFLAFDLFRTLGLPLGADAFIRLAGAVELLIGHLPVLRGRARPARVRLVPQVRRRGPGMALRGWTSVRPA
jgi:hypothetical protein